MVGAVGLTESAKGALQVQLAELGTNLIIVQAGGTFGSQNPTLPSDAVQRALAVSTVSRAAATTNISGVLALPVQGASSYYEAFPVPVRAADVNLPSVLQVSLLDGRWLNDADTRLHLHSVVLGEGIAQQYGYLPGEMRTIQLNNTNFGVVGVLGPVALDPTLDNAVFVTQWAAKDTTWHEWTAGRTLCPCRERDYTGDGKRNAVCYKPWRYGSAVHTGAERCPVRPSTGKQDSSEGRPASRLTCADGWWSRHR